jgi:ABC-type multidrug transport system fused ATPase/permease subunit
MPRFMQFRRILLPLAIRQALPGYGNEMISMVKATSLASIITLMEVTGVAARIISETYRAIEVFIVAGAIYLAINFLLTRLVQVVEYWLSPHLRLPLPHHSATDAAPALEGDAPDDRGERLLPPVALSVRNLHKSFGSVEVLKGISLDAHEGDVVSILGSSGSGKSTFLRCINLLETPNSGEVTVGGETIRMVPDGKGQSPGRRRQVDRIRSHLGMVFQSFNLWSHKTVLENVIEAPVHRSAPQKS